MSLFVIPTGETTLTESATKSLILLAPGAREVKLRQIDISVAAKEAIEEVRFEIYRVETIGAPAGTAATPQLANETDGAALAAALTLLTTEPTAVKVLASYLLQPLGGVISIPFPYGAEICSKASGARIGLRYITPTVKPKCAANLWFEE